MITSSLEYLGLPRVEGQLVTIVGSNTGQILVSNSGTGLPTWAPISTTTEEKKVSKKYYRVIKDNFLWHIGAILVKDSTQKYYEPIDETDIWDVTTHNDKEGISGPIIENSPEYFERVYPVNLLTKTVYKVKAEAMEMLSKEYKE